MSGESSQQVTDHPVEDSAVLFLLADHASKAASVVGIAAGLIPGHRGLVFGDLVIDLPAGVNEHTQVVSLASIPHGGRRGSASISLSGKLLHGHMEQRRSPESRCGSAQRRV